MSNRRLNIPLVILAIAVAVLAIFGIFKLIEYVMPRNENNVPSSTSESTVTTEPTAPSADTESTEIPSEPTAEETDDTEEPELENTTYVPKDVVTYLVIGLDDSGQTSVSGKNRMADFVTLLVVDKTDKTFSVIQFNRDTMAQVDVLGIGGRRIRTVTEQLAFAYAYGTDNSMRCRNTITSVKKLIGGINIDHYISITMDAIPLLSTYVGGVTVTLDSDEDLSSIDPAWAAGATIKLEGDDALRFIRGRQGVEDETNISRMRRQRQFMEAFMRVHKGRNISYSYVEGAYNRISEYTVTDMDSVSTLEEFARYISEYTYKEIYVPEGESKLGEEYMEFWIDEGKMQELIYKVFYEKKRG